MQHFSTPIKLLMEIYIGVIGGYMTTLSIFSSMLYLFACEASHAEPHQHNTH